MACISSAAGYLGITLSATAVVKDLSAHSGGSIWPLLYFLSFRVCFQVACSARLARTVEIFEWYLYTHAPRVPFGYSSTKRNNYQEGQPFWLTIWGRSSAGRALRSQCRGREFDPPRLHHYILISMGFRRFLKKGSTPIVCRIRIKVLQVAPLFFCLASVAYRQACC